METNDLYSRIKCAITHNLDVCNECKKCGKSSGEVRAKLVEEIDKLATNKENTIHQRILLEIKTLKKQVLEADLKHEPTCYLELRLKLLEDLIN